MAHEAANGDQAENSADAEARHSVSVDQVTPELHAIDPGLDKPLYVEQ